MAKSYFGTYLYVSKYLFADLVGMVYTWDGFLMPKNLHVFCTDGIIKKGNLSRRVYLGDLFSSSSKALFFVFLFLSVA